MKEDEKNVKNVLKIKLSEAQNHRCCYCGIKMVFEANHHNSVVIEKIIASENANDWFNLVASCYSCNNRRNGKDALEYYAWIKQNGRMRAIPTTSDVDSTLQEKIKNLVKERLSLRGVPFVLTGIIKGTEKVIDSIEKMEELVSTLVLINIKKYQSTSGRIVHHKRRWRSNTKLRKRLVNEQNHRCCYCGISVQCDHPDNHDYATIEHVIERSHGGSDKWENLVICCYVCNAHRSEVQLTAHDYYKYVKENGRNHKRFKRNNTKVKKELQDLYAVI